MVLSAYEEQRLANMKANAQKLVALGIDKAVAEIRPTKAPKRARAEKNPEQSRQPSRGSRRLAGEEAEFDDGGPSFFSSESLEEDVPKQVDALARPAKKARLTAEQSAKLDKLEEASAGPLTEDELQAVDQARECIRL
jgi:hypothetical protein